jgi:hypothetical protein
VLPFAARAQYQFFPRTHFDAPPTLSDIVLQDGFHKTMVVKLLNLSPYDMELKECDLVPDVNYVSPLTTTRLPHRLSLPTLHSR